MIKAGVPKLQLQYAESHHNLRCESSGNESKVCKPTCILSYAAVTGGGQPAQRRGGSCTAAAPSPHPSTSSGTAACHAAQACTQSINSGFIATLSFYI